MRIRAREHNHSHHAVHISETKGSTMVEQMYSKDGWDAEASVWIATSEDIPGLALEGGSFDALLERVRHAAPEILELNGCEKAAALVFSTSERRESVVS